MKKSKKVLTLKKVNAIIRVHREVMRWIVLSLNVKKQKGNKKNKKRC